MDSYEMGRALRDIQSKTAIIDNTLSSLTVGTRGNPGRRFFAAATASVLRLKGHHDRAEHLEAMVTRAVTSPATTTAAGWASELAHSQVGQLLIGLVKQSAYADLATRAQAVTLDATMPSVVVGGEINAAFVAEGNPVAVAKSTLSALQLAPKKLMALATISDELLNITGGQNLETSLRALLSSGISSTLDTVFFGTAAASAAQPAGILNGITPTTASAVTPPSEAVIADIRALLGALTVPTDPVFVAAPPRAAYLQAALGATSLPVLASAALPAGRVIAVDAGGLITGSSTTPRFASSIEATLHEDSTVLPLSATGSPNTVSAPMRGLFQTDIAALRAVFHVAWAIRSGAVSYADVTGW